MTSADNLERILKRNKASRVRQLSEIALLFEKEEQINQRRKEVEELKDNLELESQNQLRHRKELPEKFFEQQNSKRNGLLENIKSFCDSAQSESRALEVQRANGVNELKRTEAKIDLVSQKLKERKLFTELVKEEFESQEHS